MSIQRLLSIAAGLALAVGVQATGYAASQSGTAVPGFKGQVQPSLSGGSRIKKEYFDTGSPGSALASGPNTEESATVNCPGPSTCTFYIDVMDQIETSTIGSGCWAIVVVVDGNYVDGGPCTNQVANVLDTRSWTGQYPGLAPGNHTVELQTFVNAPGSQWRWTIHDVVAVP